MNAPKQDEEYNEPNPDPATLKLFNACVGYKKEISSTISSSPFPLKLCHESQAQEQVLTSFITSILWPVSTIKSLSVRSSEKKAVCLKLVSSQTVPVFPGSVSIS